MGSRCRTRTARPSVLLFLGSMASSRSSRLSASVWSRTNAGNLECHQPREYGFYSNVNPTVDIPAGARHPNGHRRRLFAGRQPTLMFNGYEAEVASLYRGHGSCRVLLRRELSRYSRRHQHCSAPGAASHCLCRGRGLGRMAILAGCDGGAWRRSSQRAGAGVWRHRIKTDRHGLAVTPLRRWAGINLLRFRRANRGHLFLLRSGALPCVGPSRHRITGAIWADIVKRRM